MARRFAFTLVALVASGTVVVPAWGQSGTGPLSVEDRPVRGDDKREKQGQQQEQQGRDAAVMMLMQELNRYQRETRELRNLVEKLQHQLKIMKEAQRERYLDLDTRLNALAEASTRSESDQSSSESDPDQSGDRPDPEADRKAYQAAKDELLKRNFEAAAEAFRGYLEDYPEGRFRAYAHFWLGEVYRNLSGREKEALKQFRTVVEKYPDHSKTPAALYKLASLQAGQGNVGEARVTLGKLRMKFPDSREAELAKGMLKQLKSDQNG